MSIFDDHPYPGTNDLTSLGLTPEAASRIRFNQPGQAAPYDPYNVPYDQYGSEGPGGLSGHNQDPNYRIGDPGQQTPNVQMDPGGQGQAMGGSPGQSPDRGAVQQFIAQWQGSHPASEGIGPLADALQSQFGVGRYMYGGTPSNNEVSLNGEKYKLLGGEGGPGAYWYQPGQNDGGGGGGFNNGLNGPYGATPFEYHYNPNDPSYQFIRDEALGAVNRNAGGRGTLNTGATWKALQDRATGLASTEYGADWQRAFNTHQADFNNGLQANQNYWGQNYQLAGLGLNATTAGINGANGMATNATSYQNGQQNNVNNQAGLLGNQGTAGANGILGGQNAWNNFYGDLGNLARRYY